MTDLLPINEKKTKAEHSQMLLSRMVGLIMSLFSLIVFLIDVLLPVDYFVGLFYILVVFFCILICPYRNLILSIAILCSVLLLIGAGNPQYYILTWDATIARYASILVIWMSVWLGLAQLTVMHSNLQLEDRFKKVFNAAPIGLILVNLEGQIVLANPQAGRLLSASTMQLIGMHFNELLPDEFGKHFFRLTHELMQSTQPIKIGHSETLWAKRVDGSKVPIEIGVNPITVAENQYALASIVDVSDRKHLEQIKDQFAGMISHEIRTPLAVISAILENLSDKVDGDLNEAQFELIGLARGNLRGVNHIIDSLSHYIRFEMGIEDIQLQPTDLNPLFEESIKNFTLLATNADKEFAAFINSQIPNVYGNLTLITQILNNMFSNALRYSESKIRLAAEMTSELPESATSISSTKKYLRISISNDGTPIPQEVQEQIFEKFYRMDWQQVSPSLGLGLYLCKKMIESHKGHIFLESNETWTTFHIYFRCV